MTTYLQDILNITELAEMIRLKRINVQWHPTLPLRIFNYSNAAQFANKWTEAERVCRGLIVDETDAVIARGPSKFFNYGQPGAPEVALDDKVWVSTKADGSLGIGWHYEGEYGVATRGSFTSEQALKATEMLTKGEKFAIKHRSENRGVSEIFEIVYPENRIVLDYQGLEKLIKLGHVDNRTGLITGRNLGILYGEGFSFEYEMTFKEALELPIPADEEGYVLDIRGPEGVTGHLKLKGENYVRLHGAIFGLSERKIWEVLASETPVDEFIAELPDELQPWAQGVTDRLNRDIGRYYSDILGAYTQAKVHFDTSYLENVPRGELAHYWMERFAQFKSPLFSLLDSNEERVFEWVHKQIKPEHKLFRVESQDVN